MATKRPDHKTPNQDAREVYERLLHDAEFRGELLQLVAEAYGEWLDIQRQFARAEWKARQREEERAMQKYQQMPF